MYPDLLVYNAMCQCILARFVALVTEHGAAGLKEATDGRLLVEALVPDFQGDVTAVRTIAASGLDVYAHNVETVSGLPTRANSSWPRHNLQLCLVLTGEPHWKVSGSPSGAML